MPQWAFDYTINISEQSSFIYFETAKVACSTIKKTLQDLEAEIAGVDPMPEVRNIHRKRVSPLKSPSIIGIERFLELLNNKNLFKFSFVRNPFSRVLSAYLDKIQKNTPEREKIIQRLGMDSNAEITLMQFLECISDTPIRKMDHHWRPQYYQIFFELIDYNMIGRFENFVHDFELILGKLYPNQSPDKLKIKRYSPHSTQASARLSNFYTEHSIKLVQDIYKRDFDNFDYDINLPIGQEKHIDELYLEHFSEGEYLLKNRNIKGAIAAFKLSLRINPDYSWAHHCLGNALFWNHQLDEAIVEYRRAIELKPDLSASYRQLGKILTKQKKKTEADHAYEMADQIDQQ